MSGRGARGKRAWVRRPVAVHGFTLVEVLVALVIVALALSAALPAATDYPRAVADLRERALAHWVAANKASELRVFGVWPDVGEQHGETRMGDVPWHWQVVVSGTPRADIRRLEIRVRPAARPEAVPFVLVDLLARPEAADG